MRAHGQATVWKTLVGARRTSDPKRWYLQLREWWAAYTAARRDAELAALNTRWDAKRERLKPLCADAAPEMAAAHGALSAVTRIDALTL